MFVISSGLLHQLAQWVPALHKVLGSWSGVMSPVWSIVVMTAVPVLFAVFAAILWPVMRASLPKISADTSEEVMRNKAGEVSSPAPRVCSGECEVSEWLGAPSPA